MLKNERQEYSRLLAKTLAYVECGKPKYAEHEALKLVRRLQEEGLLQNVEVNSDDS